MLRDHISMEVNKDSGLIAGHPFSLFEREETIAVDTAIERLELSIGQNKL